MAGAQFRVVGARVQSASAATLTPTKPTVDGAFGLMVCVVTSKNNAVHSTATAGWAKLGQINSGGSFTASIFTAAETAAAPVITWTGAAACSAQISYYSDPGNTMDTALGASSSNSGATATHSTAAVVTTRLDSLVIYVDVAAANTAIAQPSGWTEDVDAGSATDAGRTAFGNKPVATSGSSSGAISVTGANAAWVQWQIELRGTAASGLQSSKIEAGAWYAPADGLDAGKIEAGAWHSPPDGLDGSKMEAGAWLVLAPGPAFQRFDQAWPNPTRRVVRREHGLVAGPNLNLGIPPAGGQAPFFNPLGALPRTARRSPAGFDLAANPNLYGRRIRPVLFITT